MTETNMADDRAKLAAACHRDLGDPERWFKPTGYRDSLALCLIDSVYSTGVRYKTVENITCRYIKFRKESGGDPFSDGVTELLESFDTCGEVVEWAAKIGSRNKVSTRPNAILKAEAIRRIAAMLRELGIETAADLRTLTTSPVKMDEVKSRWLAVPGQRSGLTWRYGLMLAGVPEVKPDRMIQRYVARALDVKLSDLGQERAASAVAAVAQDSGWDRIHLDHAIWRFESGRPVQVST